MATVKRENGGIVGVENLPTRSGASGIWGLNEVLEARRDDIWPANFYEFPIEQSLRSDGASYLSRTPSSAGNRKTWTWSGWTKWSKLGTFHGLFASAHPTTSHGFYIGFETNYKLRIIDTDSGGFNLYTTQLFRDSSSWYHIVLLMDTTSTPTYKLYVNGAEVTSFSTNTPPSSSTDYSVNYTYIHYIGAKSYNGSINGYSDGYLANIQFIDGQALDASSFGETVSGVWVPKKYTGTYGTNGFHLDFADPNDIGNDVSGNNNHWTVN